MRNVARNVINKVLAEPVYMLNIGLTTCNKVPMVAEALCVWREPFPPGGVNAVKALTGGDATQAPDHINLNTRNNGTLKVKVTASSKECFNETYNITD